MRKAACLSEDIQAAEGFGLRNQANVPVVDELQKGLIRYIPPVRA
jgi:hypothetical protein